MAHRRLFPLVFFFLVPMPLTGQAPSISPSGDPSVQDDTIYALASDSLEYPEEPAITLFDDGIIRIEKDGTWSRTFRIVRQALTERAIRSLTELQLGYNAGHETFALNWARVVDPDSGVINEEPLHMEELDVQVSRDSPVYTDAKRVRISLGAVTVGRIVDYSYTVRDTAPFLPGDIWSSWNVNSGMPNLRSRFILDVPEEVAPRVGEVNLPGPTAEAVEDGRWVREWSYADLEAIEGEPFAADSNGVARTITVAGWVDWDDIAGWYAGLAEGRLDPTPALEQKLAELVPEGTSLEEGLRAIHKWVAQDIRYISISLGLGGYQPRSPEDLISSLSGDCKDKATLFAAMARALGAEAYPVLVSTRGRVRTDLPSISQFTHMVAAVKVGEDWLYPDLTVPVSPLDHTYSGLQGETGILLKDDGTAEIITFPADPPEANRSIIEVVGALTSEGTFSGDYTETVTGAIQYRIRSEFTRSLTDRQMEQVGRSIGSRVFADASADSVEIFDGRDLAALPQLKARVTAEDVFQKAGETVILPVRVTRYGNREIVAALEGDTLREFPVDAERVFGLKEHVTSLTFELPEGWSAELPESVFLQTAFGEYESTYALEGRSLKILRRMRGTSGIHPQESVEELLGFLRTMWEDDVELIVLKPSGLPPPA